VNPTEEGPQPSNIDLGADHEERKRLSFWHRGRVPINKKILRCGPDLSPAEKLVFLYIIERAGDGTCEARQTTIAEDLDLTDRHIRNATRKLVDLGFLTLSKRPDNRTANVYSVNLEEIYRWVDTGTQFRFKPEVSSGNKRNSVPVIPEVSSGSHTDQETETRQKRGTGSHARTREDAVNTLIFQVKRETHPDRAILEYQYGIIIDAHGPEVVLETSARLMMAGGRRRYPWPSALLELLPENEATRAIRDAPPPKPRSSSGSNPMVLPAQEVARRNADAHERSMMSMIQEWREAGIDEELLKRYDAAWKGESAENPEEISAAIWKTIGELEGEQDDATE
jgi:DNA-binding MarR family transcriptional regulator